MLNAESFTFEFFRSIGVTAFSKGQISTFPKHFRRLLISGHCSPMIFSGSLKNFFRQVTNNSEFHPVFKGLNLTRLTSNKYTHIRLILFIYLTYLALCASQFFFATQEGFYRLVPNNLESQRSLRGCDIRLLRPANLLAPLK